MQQPRARNASCNVGAPLAAHQQAPEAVQPGEAALHHPALAAATGAVGGPAAGDLRRDPPLADLAAVGIVIVAAVGKQTSGSTAGSADKAAHRRHGVQQGQQLRDVVAVAAGQQAGEWDTVGIDEEVVLGARPAPIDRARARRGAPLSVEGPPVKSPFLVSACQVTAVSLRVEGFARGCADAQPYLGARTRSVRPHDDRWGDPQARAAAARSFEAIGRLPP